MIPTRAHVPMGMDAPGSVMKPNWTDSAMGIRTALDVRSECENKRRESWNVGEAPLRHR